MQFTTPMDPPLVTYPYKSVSRGSLECTQETVPELVKALQVGVLFCTVGRDQKRAWLYDTGQLKPGCGRKRQIRARGSIRLVGVPPPTRFLGGMFFLFILMETED